MLRNTSILWAASLWLLLGCQGADEPAANEEIAAAPVAETPAASKQAETPPDIDPSEIVWADEAFLDEAGVKEGQNVIYLPTPPMVVDKMIEMADVKKTDLVYDLGTGDGRIAIAVAKQTGCKAIGFEIDAELVKQARENVRAAGVEDLVTIEEKDILTLDFSPADVVMMYLNPELNVQLIPQMNALKDGARVVSHDWGMDGQIVADQVIENFKSKEPDFVNLHTLYMWKTPFRPSE